MYYSRTENERGEKELLSLHLKRTAEFAKQFAKEFGEGEAGELCGLFHDAGKASEMFQDVLLNKEHGVNHEAAGAFFLLNMRFLLLTRVIFAHHKGLCWDIETQLMRSYNEKDSFESRSENRRFSVSGKEQYDKVYAYHI